MALCKANKSIIAYDDDEEEDETPDNLSLDTTIIHDNDNNDILNTEPAQSSVKLQPQLQSRASQTNNPQRQQHKRKSNLMNTTSPTKSTFQLALPPPKLHRPGVLRISSLLILQIQQLSLLARRPVPVLEIRRPSMLAPVKLSKEFLRRVRLTSKDYYITRIEPYMSIPCSESRKSDSETEDDDDKDERRRRRRRQGSTNTNANTNKNNANTNNQQHQHQQYHPIIAAIKLSRKRKDHYHQGKMYLRHGRIWKATTLSNGICRFAVADGTGSNIIVQLEKLPRKKQQQQQHRRRSSQTTSSQQLFASPSSVNLSISSTRDGTDGLESKVSFGIWIINQETKRSVLVGSITRYNIELYLDRALRNVYDGFWVCLVPPVVLDSGEECCHRAGDGEDWEGRLYTLIGTFGVWMAFREGWVV